MDSLLQHIVQNLDVAVRYIAVPYMFSPKVVKYDGVWSKSTEAEIPSM